MKSRKLKKVAMAKAYMAKRKGDIPIESDSDAVVESMGDESANEENEMVSGDELIRQDDDSSEEEEVLAITDDEHDVEGEDEQDSEGGSKDGLPNRDAWGKKKSAYYSTDFVDEDRGKSYREDAEKANAELEEALAIQRSVSKYTNVCLTEELLLEMPDESAEAESEDEADLDALTKDQKLKLLKKRYPEVLMYKKELIEKLNEIKDRMLPLVEYARDGKILSNEWVNYIHRRYEILVFYCLNMSFYFVLKAKGHIPSNHPVFKRVKEFKEYLSLADNETETIQQDLDLILEKLREKGVVDLEDKEMDDVEERNITLEQDESGEEDSAVEKDEDSNAVDGKRTITYQIAKNKGLVARRKKECRNPRVHHRMKYKKAQIRRKGQVRNVLKEIKRYDGEPTGISKHVVRSIKFK